MIRRGVGKLAMCVVVLIDLLATQSGACCVYVFCWQARVALVVFVCFVGKAEWGLMVLYILLTRPDGACWDCTFC